MGDSMMTLFTQGVLGDDLNDITDVIVQDSNAMLYVWILFCLISSILLLNMMIGVLCEVITSKAEEEREQLTECEMRVTLADAFHKMDANHDNRVTVQEWDTMKEDPEVRKS